MSKRYHVQADWDAEAKVWVSSSNIPGLHIEADTLGEFMELVEALAPEMLSDNLGIHGPVPLDVQANGVLLLTVA
ncbi:DUF1902 domain-containing protein [Caulobacter mirabilis]|uniref:DUF1902 domain-containing protein n=1 Tax=Caulobacter mirabilis TaxID=69666 RepID=A0A2D2ATH3_9CAUL|nr:DUF1902 domain-containing protein [Caulobacter mirabilis]ATQ41291.1 hypothetical protein CSW64_02120 [Caulobacter mirabilis]